MADIFEIVTKFIQSPPGQLAAGAALGGIVWKFFEQVETVLNESAKLKITLWLLGITCLSLRRPELSSAGCIGLQKQIFESNIFAQCARCAH